eukprot:gene17506-19256_t
MADHSESRLPSVVNIRDLKPGAKNLHLVFIVLDIGKPTKTKDGHEVRSCKVADRTASINASVWDESGSYLQPGDIIRFCKGYAQVWKNQLTIYTGRAGYLEKIGEFCMVFSEIPNMSEPNPEFINMAKQNLAEKGATTSDLLPTQSPSNDQHSLPSTLPLPAGSSNQPNPRYHPYQRENSNTGALKNEVRIDPRLARKVPSNGANNKPKDPRMPSQTAQPPLRPASNQVNTNRDPRQRR